MTRLVRLRAAVVVVAALAADAFAGSIHLTSGPAGTFMPGQSYNETRAVDVKVLSASAISVNAMRLDALSIGGATSATVGARVYDSTSALIASADVVVTSGGSVTIPIAVTLASGSEHRIGFYVETNPLFQASATVFDPDPPSIGGFPYVESTGKLRIEAAWSVGSDSYPINMNTAVPEITLYTDFGTPFCFPGTGGVMSCPCGNPPISGTTGCNNFGPNPPGGTGGANLASTGVASLSSDSLQFQVTDEIVNTSNVSVLWQGTTTLALGAQAGAGVRCVGGTLKRLYKGNAFSGAIDFPSGVQDDVHTTSAAKGFTIVPPVTLHYYVAYRNAAAGAPCGSPTLAFNTTNAMSIPWEP
jgi:hypothetical protein